MVFDLGGEWLRDSFKHIGARTGHVIVNERWCSPFDFLCLSFPEKQREISILFFFFWVNKDKFLRKNETDPFDLDVGREGVGPEIVIEEH